MYSLTEMTGREASAGRTVVIGTVEMNWRVWIILLCGAPFGVLSVLVLWPVIGQLAVFAFPVIEGAAVFLIHRRTKDGLKVRTYQAFWDKQGNSLAFWDLQRKQRPVINSFMICGQRLEYRNDDYRRVTPNTVTYKPAPPAASTSLVNQDY